MPRAPRRTDGSDEDEDERVEERADEPAAGAPAAAAIQRTADLRDADGSVEERDPNLTSAAMCVLVARAFSRLYEIKMTLRGEMEYAYQGEVITPSRCGRMDQGCAFGCRPILMT